MGQFSGQFSGYFAPNRSSYRVALVPDDPFTYSTGAHVYRLAGDQSCDLNVEPRVLWLLPEFDSADYAQAAVMYDNVVANKDVVGLTFHQANCLLEHMLIDLRCPPLLAHLFRVACDLGARAQWEASPVRREPDLFSRYIFSRVFKLVQQRDWETFDDWLGHADFYQMSPPAVHTLFATTDLPTISQHLPSRFAAKQRCAQVLDVVYPKAAHTEEFRVKYR